MAQSSVFSFDLQWPKYPRLISERSCTHLESCDFLTHFMSRSWTWHHNMPKWNFLLWQIELVLILWLFGGLTFRWLFLCSVRSVSWKEEKMTFNCAYLLVTMAGDPRRTRRGTKSCQDYCPMSISKIDCFLGEDAACIEAKCNSPLSKLRKCWQSPQKVEIVFQSAFRALASSSSLVVAVQNMLNLEQNHNSLKTMMLAKLWTCDETCELHLLRFQHSPHNDIPVLSHSWDEPIWFSLKSAEFHLWTDLRPTEWVHLVGTIDNLKGIEPTWNKSCKFWVILFQF